MDKPVFPTSFFRELAAENPLGLALDWREAKAWFEFIAWPKYKTYSYTLHGRAVRRWWASIKMEEISRAREAMERASLGDAQKQQDQLQSSQPDEVSPDTREALRLIMGGGGGRA